MPFQGAFSSGSGGGSPATTAAQVDDYGVIVEDDDALVLEFATSTEEVVLTLEDFDGLPEGFDTSIARNLTFTFSASVGSYATGTPIAIASTAHDDSAVTEDVTITAANGGNTRTGTKAHKLSTTTITIPPMNDANGTIKVGVGSIVGLRYKAFYTDADFPYVDARVDGQIQSASTTSRVGAPPFGAVDFSGLMNGECIGATYVRDLT